MRKKIGVFFDALGENDYPFTFGEYRIAYPQIAQLIEDRGSHFYIVRSIKTFLGGNRFKGYWEFDGTWFARHEEEIELDLIYDKGMFVGDEKSRLLNDVKLNQLCVDKRETIAFLPQYSPKTVTVQNKIELLAALSTWPSDMVVAKPVDGAEAQGVVIGSKDVVAAAEHQYPLLVQQYVDTSGGIPGIVEGVCDMRTVIIDEEIALTYVRKAKEGTFVSNISKGGKEIEILPEKRPLDAMKIVREIDEALQPLSKHRVYCVDLGRDKDGRWYLIELNSKPGLSVRAYGPSYPRYQDLLVEALIAAASD